MGIVSLKMQTKHTKIRKIILIVAFVVKIISEGKNVNGTSIAHGPTKDIELSETKE